MRFPNAAKGVSKIFIAEILMLIGAIVTLIGAVLVMGSSETLVESFVADELTQEAGVSLGMTYAGGSMIMLASLIVMLIGEILLLVGLWQTGKDEPIYAKKAFWFAIILIVVGIVNSCLTASGNESFARFAQVASDVLNILVFTFTIYGINQLAQQVNRSDIAALGNKIVWILVAVLVISLILKIISNTGVIGGIGSIAASVLSIVMIVAYLVFLAKAKNALKAN